MKDLKRNPGLLLFATLLVSMSLGCQSTNWTSNRLSDWSGAGSPTDLQNAAPQLGAPTPNPNDSGVNTLQEFSTAKPQQPEPAVIKPQWEKSVPLIRGRIDLGPPSTTPPAEMLPKKVTTTAKPALSAPLMIEAPSATVAPAEGPELPLFVDEPAHEPEFQIELPTEALQNEPITLKIDLVNPDSRARGPFRLSLLRSESIHNLSPVGDTLTIDELKPSERRTQTFSLAVAAPGEHCLELKLTEGDREVSWKKVCVIGRPQQLEAVLTGPKMKPLGQRGEFTLSVVNTSTEPLGNVSAVLQYDRSIVPVEASEGAVQKTGQLAWQIPVLQPGEALYLQVEFDCSQETRSACVTADVSANGLPGVQRKACLAVERVPGTLQVVLSDQNDLARVGQDVTLALKVTNVGLQPARKLVAELDLPSGLELSDYTVYRLNEVVPLPSNVNEGVLRFESVGELLADQTLEYRIILRTKMAGSYELTGRITDELHRLPVLAKEPLTVTP